MESKKENYKLLVKEEHIIDALTIINGLRNRSDDIKRTFGYDEDGHQLVTLEFNVSIHRWRIIVGALTRRGVPITL